MSLPPPPGISVIIAVYNGTETLGACLEALQRSDFQDFEVVVVNDGSTDQPHPIARRYPCTVIDQDNRGPGPARNLGARVARGAILFFLDADVLVEPDSLSRIAGTFAARSDAGALFGSYGKTTPPRNFVSVYKNLLHHHTHQTAEDEAATFCGGFGAIRREAFEAVGGFHPSHRFLEDVEMGYRLHQAGTRILLRKDLQFTHLKRYTLWSLIRSDFLGRAVPWTRLMLSKRLFRNDLNTRTHNVISVPCSLLLGAAIIVSPAAVMKGHGPTALAVCLTLAVWLAWLNRAFLGLLAAEQGGLFTLKSLAMLWLGYIYSAIGVLAGTWQHLTSPLTTAQSGRSGIEAAPESAEGEV